jgi:hypothetical protein
MFLRRIDAAAGNNGESHSGFIGGIAMEAFEFGRAGKEELISLTTNPGDHPVATSSPG